MNRSILSTNRILSVYNRLFLNQCYLCAFKGEGLLCRHCQSFLSYNIQHCQQCARPLPITLECCGECQSSTPAFDQIIAPLQYEGLCRKMIRKAKFEQQPHLLRPLIRLLAEHIAKCGTNIPIHWAIVPTSESSLKKRGFCQTEFIRQQLKYALQGKELIKDIHFIDIKRIADRAAQHTLSLKERAKLSHKYFEVEAVTAKHIILIDDLVTTGSTVNACSQALKKAGAEQVTVWALARTPEQTGDHF